MIEHDLYLMQSWFSVNKLSLNINKTVAMKFWHNTSDFNVTINNEKVPTVESTKFLGLHLDSALSWHFHINHLIGKLNCNKRLLMMSKNLLNTLSLKKVYFSHIHTHLNYGLTVWGSMVSATQLTSLKRIQEQCIRIIAKDTMSNIDNLHVKLCVPTIANMIKHKLCLLGHLINHKQIPRPIRKLFKAHGGEKQHRYPTRNKNIPNLQQHQSHIFNKSFLCQSFMEYVKLPSYIKARKSTTSFNGKIKNYLMQVS